MPKYIITTLLCCLICSAAMAQQWQEMIDEIIDTEEYDEEAMTEAYELLSELEEHPLNINDATYEEMARIPGMDIDIISDIMYYRDTFGAMRSMVELTMIPSISANMRKYLMCFFRALPPTADVRKRPIRHSGTTTVSTAVPLYTRAADRKGWFGEPAGDFSTDKPDQMYLGARYKYSVKHKGKVTGLSLGNHDFETDYALVAAQDAGEPFLNKYNKGGFDFYSGYVRMKMDTRREGWNAKRRTLDVIAGRYRTRFGQGLTLNNNFSLGKQYMLSGMGNASSAALSGHASRSDGHFLQGFAASANIAKGIDVTALWSYRALDATLNSDGTVKTLVTSPYHRTINDIAKRNNTHEMTSGAHIAFSPTSRRITDYGKLTLGMSLVYTWYDRDLVPTDTEKKDYRTYYPTGNSFTNIGIDYNFHSPRFTIAGETATDMHHIATVNMLSTRLSRSISAALCQRFYSYKYTATMARAMSEGGRVQNESGIYAGISWQALRNVKVDFYTDYAYFAWLRYHIAAGSSAWDNHMTVTYNRKTWQATCRYRYRKRQADEHSLRFMLQHTDDRIGGVTWRTQCDFRAVSEEDSSFGWALGQTATLRTCNRLSVSATGAYFKSTDYDSRLYIFERNMPESFSSASYYGHGFRLSAVMKFIITPKLTLNAKAGHTKQFDRSTISSAAREIMHSYQSDIELQLKIKL